MTTRVTEDSRRFFLSSQAAALVSRVDARARVHSSPLTKSEEKRETTRRLHFTYLDVLWKCFSLQLQNQKSCFFVSNQCLSKQVLVTKYSDVIYLHNLSLTGPLPVRGRCPQTKVKLSISLWGIHLSLFLSALAARFVLQDK